MSIFNTKLAEMQLLGNGIRKRKPIKLIKHNARSGFFFKKNTCLAIFGKKKDHEDLQFLFIFPPQDSACAILIH